MLRLLGGALLIVALAGCSSPRYLGQVYHITTDNPLEPPVLRHGYYSTMAKCMAEGKKIALTIPQGPLTKSIDWWCFEAR